MWLVLLACWSAPAAPVWGQDPGVQASNVEERALAKPDEIDRATQGFKMSLVPGVFFPSPQDRAGFSMAGEALYDVRLGRVVMAPGLRVTGYFTRGFTGLSGLATLNLGLRLGPVLPYVIGGGGLGYSGTPEEWGVGYLGGGGVLVIVRSRLAFGAEATLQGFARTEFQAGNLAAIMQFSY